MYILDELSLSYSQDFNCNISLIIKVKKVSNDQELVQSEPKSHPRKQNGTTNKTYT